MEEVPSQGPVDLDVQLLIPQRVKGCEWPMTAGQYNANAQLQAHALQPSLDLLVTAASALPLTPGRPIHVADLGCSQGINSIQPVKTILSALRSRVPPQQQLEVVVTHEDQPTNDFHSLLGLVNSTDPDQTYLPQGPSNVSVFSQLLGRSFHERLFPASSVHLTFSFSALHWMPSRPPPSCRCLAVSSSADEEAKAAYAAEAEAVLTSFLRLRAVETIPGGALVANFPAMGDDEDTSSIRAWGMRLLEVVAAEHVQQGKISAEELANMAVPVALRSERSVRASLEAVKQQWTVKSLFIEQAPTPYYDRFAAGAISAEELAASAVAQCAAVLRGSLTAQLALTRPGGEQEAAALVEGMLQDFRRKLAAEPQEAAGGICFMHLALERTGSPLPVPV